MRLQAGMTVILKGGPGRPRNDAQYAPFTEDTASKSGVSARTVRRGIQPKTAVLGGSRRLKTDHNIHG